MEWLTQYGTRQARTFNLAMLYSDRTCRLMDANRWKEARILNTRFRCLLNSSRAMRQEIESRRYQTTNVD